MRGSLGISHLRPRDAVRTTRADHTSTQPLVRSHLHIALATLVAPVLHPRRQQIESFPQVVKPSCSTHGNPHGRRLADHSHRIGRRQDSKRPLIHVAHVSRCPWLTAPRSGLLRFWGGSRMYKGSIGFIVYVSTFFRFRLVRSPFHVFPFSSRLLLRHSPR